MTKFEPLEDRVLYRVIKSKEPEVSAGGIITETVKKKVVEAEVIAVGVGSYARETGVFMPTVLAKGDVVLVGADSGQEIMIPGENGVKEECRVVREMDILFRVQKKSAENN